MNWLTIDDLMLWCREVDSDDTRQVLTTIADAVELSIEQYLKRPLFAYQEELDAIDPKPDHALVVNAAIKQAAMMLVSHFNENRETSTELNLDDLPFGFDYLLNDYRIRSNP